VNFLLHAGRLSIHSFPLAENLFFQPRRTAFFARADVIRLNFAAPQIARIIKPAMVL
jgi:hypothetical protein